jgi:hypothetical protein
MCAAITLRGRDTGGTVDVSPPPNRACLAQVDRFGNRMMLSAASILRWFGLKSKGRNEQIAYKSVHF